MENNFKGLVDLVQLKAYFFHGSNGSVSETFALVMLVVILQITQFVSYCREKVVVGEVPRYMEALVSGKRRELMKIVSEVDDKLAEAFGGHKPISTADLKVCE